MSFLQKSVLTFSVSSSGVATAQHTTVYNGLFYSAHILPSKAGSTKQIVTITPETTTRQILKVVDPSTLGLWYQPRMAGRNTTGASSALNACIPLANERVRVAVACSSGTASRTITVTAYIA